MKEALILFAIGFIVACWIFVIGHQLGVSAFHDVEGLAQASIPIAYTTAALTGGIAIAAFVAAVFKR